MNSLRKCPFKQIVCSKINLYFPDRGLQKKINYRTNDNLLCLLRFTYMLSSSNNDSSHTISDNY